MVITTGVETTEARLRQIQQRVLRAAEAGVETALRAMGDTLADYPTELPDQRYVRTNALHDGWADADVVFQTMGEGLLGSLTNPVEYGPFVEGAEQAPVHVGRWPTTQGVQEAQTDAARDAIDAAVQAGVRGG